MSDSVDEGIFGEPKTNLDTSDIQDLDLDSEKVVSARGTEDGLVLRIDGGAQWSDVLSELEAFLGGRKRFFEGGQVLIEWLERLPSKELCTQLEQLLKEQYGLSIGTRRRRSQLGSITGAMAKISAQKKSEENESDVSAKASSLVDEIEQIASGLESSEPISLSGLAGDASMNPDMLDPAAMHQILSEDLFADEDANAKVVFGTVRSGQRVESPFSLIIVGDVNPGGDLIAGGDIIVLGSLRGTAHASAYDDDGFDTVIIAMHMRPMQLRIGSIISRGSDEDVKQPEIARIENRRIVVESFNSRAAYWRKS